MLSIAMIAGDERVGSILPEQRVASARLEFDSESREFGLSSSALHVVEIDRAVAHDCDVDDALSPAAEVHCELTHSADQRIRQGNIAAERGAIGTDANGRFGARKASRGCEREKRSAFSEREEAVQIS